MPSRLIKSHDDDDDDYICKYVRDRGDSVYGNRAAADVATIYFKPSRGTLKSRGITTRVYVQRSSFIFYDNTTVWIFFFPVFVSLSLAAAVGIIRPINFPVRSRDENCRLISYARRRQFVGKLYTQYNIISSPRSGPRPVRNNIIIYYYYFRRPRTRENSRVNGKRF